MQEGAGDEDVAGAVAVEDRSEDWALDWLVGEVGVGVGVWVIAYAEEHHERL